VFLHGKKGLDKKDKKRWCYDKILVFFKEFAPILEDELATSVVLVLVLHDFLCFWSADWWIGLWKDEKLHYYLKVGGSTQKDTWRKMRKREEFYV
jgi:hypothetical protein